jgi:hypothetical protein
MAYFGASPYGGFASGYGAAPSFGYGQPAFASYGGAPAFASYGQPAFAPQAQFSPWTMNSGISIPAELQPLQYRQPTNAQTLFSGHPQSHLFGQGPSYGQAAPQQLFSAQPVQLTAAPVFAPVAAAGAARPVDIYASAASAISHASHMSAVSQHSLAASIVGSQAGSVISHHSAISAPQVYAQAARAVRRRGTEYGSWKDSHNVVRSIPRMHNRMPDPLQNPKRTSFRKWKDMQDIFGRLGLK